MIYLSITAIALAVVAIAFAAHVAVVYQRFNDGIKEWAQALDDSSRAAIDRQAMAILRELDQRITKEKESAETSVSAQEEQDVEPINNNENE